MTTSNTNNDAKKAGGYFKEKLAIGVSRVTGDEVERAIMKVSSHMLKSPNDKHLTRLLEATFGRMCRDSATTHGTHVNYYIVDELEKRSHTHNWIIVLKTMIVFHALMQEGSTEVNRLMQRKRNLFSGRNLKDVADSPDGAAQQVFITQYTRYLEERNITQARIDVDIRIEREEYLRILRSLPLNILAEIMQQLIGQLECVHNIEYRERTVDNFATLEAWVRTINDSRYMYRLLSDRMIFVLEQFETMELVDKQLWLLIYVRYNRALGKLSRLFTTMARSRRAFGVEFPQITVFPESLTEKLREDIEYSAMEQQPMEQLSSVDQSVAPSSMPVGTVVSGDTSAAKAEAGNEQYSPPKEAAPLPPQQEEEKHNNEAAAAAAAAEGESKTQEPPQQEPQPQDEDFFGGGESNDKSGAKSNESAAATAGGGIISLAKTQASMLDDIFGPAESAARQELPPMQEQDFDPWGDVPSSAPQQQYPPPQQQVPQPPPSSSSSSSSSSSLTANNAAAHSSNDSMADGTRSSSASSGSGSNTPNNHQQVDLFQQFQENELKQRNEQQKQQPQGLFHHRNDQDNPFGDYYSMVSAGKSAKSTSGSSDRSSNSSNNSNSGNPAAAPPSVAMFGGDEDSSSSSNDEQQRQQKKPNDMDDLFGGRDDEHSGSGDGDSDITKSAFGGGGGDGFAW